MFIPTMMSGSTSSCALNLLFMTFSLPRASAQDIQFTNVPTSVTEGTENLGISVSGVVPGVPWTAQLVQSGRVIDNLSDDDEEDGAAGSFEWDVELDDNVGGYYSLRFIQGTQTVDSGPIAIIDEAGRGPTGPPPGAPSTAASAAPTTDPSATPTNAAESVSQVSASIAATASTLVTTIISGSTVTAQPENTSPGGNSTSGPTDGGGGSNDLSGGAIAGIVIGVILFLLLIGLLVWFMRRRMRKSRGTHRHPGTHSDEKGGNALSTPSAFSGLAGVAGSAGASKAIADGSKAELHSDDKPMRTAPGTHEIASSDDGRSTSAPHELYSPNDSQNTQNIAGFHRRSDSTPTDWSGSAGDRSSASELVGSPVSDGSTVSPQSAHAIPRKTVPGQNTTSSSGGGRPPTIHELG